MKAKSIKGGGISSAAGTSGLVGFGNGAYIQSSYAIVGEIMGTTGVGGLGGEMFSLWSIVSSHAVVGNMVSDTSDIGGLVGISTSGRVVLSSVVVGSVAGPSVAGGLMGLGDDTDIISSFVVAGAVMGDSNIGDLVGRTNSNTVVTASYWDSDISGTDRGRGTAQTTTALTNPTNTNAYDAGSIYATWDDGADIDDTAGVENSTIWCDSDLSGTIEEDEKTDGTDSGTSDNRIWDFGTSSQYPAIRCLPVTLEEQRDWWSINSTTGDPMVNPAYLPNFD